MPLSDSVGYARAKSSVLHGKTSPWLSQWAGGTTVDLPDGIDGVLSWICNPNHVGQFSPSRPCDCIQDHLGLQHWALVFSDSFWSISGPNYWAWATNTQRTIFSSRSISQVSFHVFHQTYLYPSPNILDRQPHGPSRQR